MNIKTSIFIIFISVFSLFGFAKYYDFPVKNLFSVTFYQSMANPSVRIIRIEKGFRREEVAETLTEGLGWSSSEKLAFLNAPIALGKESLEGQYFPATYLIHKDDSPVTVTHTMINRFTDETKNIKKIKKTKIISQDTALKIASLIQREAAGKEDMNLISGIIWNRLFKGMRLQIDATLQYAKGDEENWWPQVEPDDKDINSPYNTYTNTNLPPTPISNPGLQAIEAAYNPQTTTCLYYIHDKNRKIHCSATYQGQLNNIKKYY